MSFIGRRDDEFEHALLRSASRDAPDAGATERAWARFVALMAGVAMTSGLPEGVAGSPGKARSVGRFSRIVDAATWMVVGAIGGSAATLALVSRPGASYAVATSVSPLSTSGPPDAGAAQPVTATAPSVGLTVEAQQSASVAPTLSASRAPAQASSLAAEVATLDRARRALGAGTPDEALAVLRGYLRDFPKGKLVPEAQVMGIEALAAKGDRAGVAKEATRFMGRYPNAPQRMRVEQLREESAEK